MRIVLTVMLALAILAIQVLYGGMMRTVFCLPGYALLASTGALSVIVVLWRRAVSPNGTAVVSVLVAGGYLLWRALESPGQDLSIFYSLLVLGCMTAYFVGACVITTPVARYVFVSVLLAAVVVQAVIAAMQFTSEQDFFVLPWVSEQFRLWFGGTATGIHHRGHGTFLSGNHLAWFFNVMIFFSLGVAVFGRCRIWVRIVFTYLAGVCAAGVLITLSRGGAVGLGAGLLVFSLLALGTLFLGARDRRLIFLLGTGAILGLTAAGGYLVFRSSDMVKARLDLVTEDSYRLNLWRAAIRQVQIEPLLGTGAGSFTNLSRRLSEYMTGANDMYAHNDWAQTATDFGFVGLVLVSGAFALNLRAGAGGFAKALRDRMAVSSQPQSNSAAFLAGAVCACTASAVHSFFDYNMQIPANAVLVAACLGLMANSGLPSVRRTWGSAPVRILTAISACACGLLLLVLAGRSSAVEVQGLIAENAMLSGRYAEAVSVATQALGISPGHSRISRLRADSRLRSAAPATAEGQWALGSAAEDLRLAIAGDPEERWNYFLLGMTLARLEDINGAEQAHIEAIRLDPGSPLLYEYYAVTLEQYGRLEDAERIYDLSRHIPGNKFSLQRLDVLRRIRNTR